MAQTILLYTQPEGWHFCDLTEEYLLERGALFQKRDVINDQTAMDELMEIGVMTTPVTAIDGEVVVGFNPERLEELLSA